MVSCGFQSEVADDSVRCTVQEHNARGGSEFLCEIWLICSHFFPKNCFEKIRVLAFSHLQSDMTGVTSFVPANFQSSLY